MSELKIVVPGMSRRQIEDVAERVRGIMGVTGPHMPVAEFLEIMFPKLRPEFTLEILNRDEMGSKHGAVDPYENRLMLREDVYDGMIEDRGRDRFTVSHELGHALLHTRITLNRVREKPKPYEDPEWQANTFASALLMPERHMRSMRSIHEIMNVFGVSQDAAEVRLRKLEMRLPTINPTQAK